MASGKRGWLLLSGAVLTLLGVVWLRKAMAAPAGPVVEVQSGDQLFKLSEGTRVAITGTFSLQGGGGADPPSRPAYGIVMPGTSGGGFSVAQWVVGVSPKGVVEGDAISLVAVTRTAKGMGYRTGYGHGGEGGGQDGMSYLEAESVEILPALTA